ncbi:MAG: SDR family NAD(P)-dependent oxidoreductase [Ktedonobacteraceae bacterium]|nr:SDR family NAD(P)-dependent oxidoreductase [Ktedonobacteraceae bacterium]
MTNNVCTIIGAGPGLSLAVARRFAREGYAISLLARRAEALDDYAAHLRQSGAIVAGFAVDVADQESLKTALASSRSELGATNVLVYNAAVMKPAQPSALSSATLLNDFKVNVAGPLLAAQDVLADMRAAKSGTILFTGGGLALHPSAQYTSLTIGKASVRVLAYCLGEELEPEGIHVATVTIAGTIQAGDPRFDPDLVAENYWQLHSQPKDKWQREIVY